MPTLAILLALHLATCAMPQQPSSAHRDVAAVQPIRVYVRCLDGREIRGAITAWDDRGFTGDFGQIKWAELHAEDAWHILAQMIDPNSPQQWHAAGRIIREVPGGQHAARRAFRWASWLSHEQAKDADQALADLQGRFPTTQPASAPQDPHRRVGRETNTNTTPWPARTETEQATAVRELRREADKVLAVAGITMRAYENSHFILYADVAPEAAQEWLDGLEAVYRSLALTFDIPPDRNIFWGRAVVIFCSTYEDFRTVLPIAFPGQPAPPREMGGLTSPAGPKVISIFWRMPDEARLNHTVAHEVTHAFMHRYISGVSFPLWFEEGLAEYAASIVTIDSPIEKERVPRAVSFVLTDGPIDNILDMTCMHDAWPGPRQVGYGVSYLLVRAMFEMNPRGALAFTRAVKAGKPWQQALADDFGMDRRALVEAFVRRVREERAARPGAAG